MHKLNSISLNWTSKHVPVKGQIVKKNVKVDLSSISSTKTLNLRSKIRWKTGHQKTHRNDCEQSRDGTKRAGMKGRLRVVRYSRQHKEIKETTEVQVEGGGKQKLKQVDGDFPARMRRENNNNEKQNEKK